MNNISDICDGSIYKGLCSTNWIDGNDLSAILNTDGISIFHSNNYSL